MVRSSVKLTPSCTAYFNMTLKRISRILRTNLHFVWVILFFIFHGYSQYQQLIPVKDLILLAVELLIGGFLLFWISTLLFQNKNKSGIFTSFVLVLILFFGVFQDFFGSIRLLSVLSYLRLLILIFLVTIALVFYFLKRSGKDFRKAVIYINGLFLIYLLIDIFSIFYQSILPSSGTTKSPVQFKSSGCDSCKMPSVYLIILDEYLGSQGLKEYFNYDNANFETVLFDRGFKVIKNPTSNYQLTLFSMASLLNMNYIHDLDEQKLDDHYVYKKILSTLRNNLVCDIFRNNGYRLINFSNFEIKNAPSENLPSELPQKIQLITSQTMVYRMMKYLPVWLEQVKIVKNQKKGGAPLVNPNEEIIRKTLSVSRDNQQSPAFVYLHLMMPHLPYAYDSSGRKRMPDVQNPKSQPETDMAYLQYLVYTNHRISQFIFQLQEFTRENAIILLMSDHGYRTGMDKNLKLGYQTFNAVFLPNKNYKDWYDGMSNVNQFPLIFNSVFGLNIPLLKDSIAKHVNSSGGR